MPARIPKFPENPSSEAQWIVQFIDKVVINMKLATPEARGLDCCSKQADFPHMPKNLLSRKP